MIVLEMSEKTVIIVFRDVRETVIIILEISEKLS